MDTLILVSPGPEHKLAAADYVREHQSHGEGDLHGASLLEKMPSYEAWLAHLAALSQEQTLPEGWVLSSVFFAVRKQDGRIVGTVDIRHRLNDFLRHYGGNIGYGIRPTERGQGYAGQVLAMALDVARGLGLSRVMLSCEKDNTPSRRVIQSAGGVLERTFTHTDGQHVCVFWIDL